MSEIKTGGLDQYGAERCAILSFAAIRKSVGLSLKGVPASTALGLRRRLEVIIKNDDERVKRTPLLHHQFITYLKIPKHALGR